MAKIIWLRFAGPNFFKEKMLDREDLNLTDYRELERQAKILVSKFTKPSEPLTDDLNSSSQASNETPGEFRVDPATGKRYRVVNHILRAADIKGREKPIPYMGVKPPNQLNKRP